MTTLSGMSLSREMVLAQSANFRPHKVRNAQLCAFFRIAKNRKKLTVSEMEKLPAKKLMRFAQSEPSAAACLFRRLPRPAGIGPQSANHIDSVAMTPMTEELAELIADVGSVAVLTGAGVSTGSGIPDYRDRDGEWKHAPPMQFAEFAASDAARQRYWARSYVGWQRFGTARPNAAHHALARLEASGKVDTVITQNVDRLHSRAGSESVIDLHGDLGKVRCIDCNETSPRYSFQRELKAANPDWHAQVFRYRPDGDVELAEDNHANFAVPGCSQCGGRIKPDVVMFGESVPKNRVEDAMSTVDRTDALLIAGSSLMVFSGFRFARRAHETGKPIAIVNRGKTRADDLATVKVEADCGDVLSQLCGDDIDGAE